MHYSVMVNHYYEEIIRVHTKH